MLCISERDHCEEVYHETKPRLRKQRRAIQLLLIIRDMPRFCSHSVAFHHWCWVSRVVISVKIFPHDQSDMELKGFRQAHCVNGNYWRHRKQIWASAQPVIHALLSVFSLTAEMVCDLCPTLRPQYPFLVMGFKSNTTATGESLLWWLSVLRIRKICDEVFTNKREKKRWNRIMEKSANISRRCSDDFVDITKAG